MLPYAVIPCCPALLMNCMTRVAHLLFTRRVIGTGTVSLMMQIAPEEQRRVNHIPQETIPSLSTPKAYIRVMLADDHELIRQGLRAILELEDDIIVIGEAVNGVNLCPCRRGWCPTGCCLDGLANARNGRR